MVAAGVAGFGVVVGWWAASLAGLRRPSRRAGGGMAAGLLSSAVLVVLLTGYGSLVAFGFGATVGAATRVVFLAIAARQHLSKGPP